jgi:hypothetical protein
VRAWLALPACVLLLTAGCGSGGKKTAAPPAPAASRPATGAPPWKLPPDPLRRIVQAGLQPGSHEFLLVHRHAHLDILVNGKPVRIPGGIGIEISDPGVQTGAAADGTPEYGGIQECVQPCISPLHTHSDDGILHTESTDAKPNELGQLFTEWGVRLTARCVGGYCKPGDAIRVYVDGNPFAGDARTIALTDLKEIAIVIGKPPSTIPSSFRGG